MDSARQSEAQAERREVKMKEQQRYVAFIFCKYSNVCGESTTAAWQYHFKALLRILENYVDNENWWENCFQFAFSNSWIGKRDVWNFKFWQSLLSQFDWLLINKIKHRVQPNEISDFFMFNPKKAPIQPGDIGKFPKGDFAAGPFLSSLISCHHYKRSILLLALSTKYSQ